MTESDWERISLIMVGCKVSQEDAIEIYKRQLIEEKSRQFANESVEKLKQAKLRSKMRNRFDGKSKAFLD